MGEEELLGWDLYFPEEVFSPDAVQIDFIQSFVTSLEESDACPTLEDVEFNHSIPVDYSRLKSVIPPKLSALIENEPEMGIACLGIAFCNLIYRDPRRSGLIKKITPRLENFGYCTPLRSLKSNCIGKFLSIKGTVVRVGHIRPYVNQMNFECGTCEQEMTVHLKDGKYK